MILDQLSNAAFYQFPNPRIAHGLKFLQSEKITSLALGRTDINGDHLFALVQEYSTRVGTDGSWEAHRKYIDIQFLLTGRERIDHAPISSLQIAKPYDVTKDRVELAGNGSVLELSAGTFAIFFPHDAHCPCMAASIPTSVRKIVLKVKAGDYDR